MRYLRACTYKKLLTTMVLSYIYVNYRTIYGFTEFNMAAICRNLTMSLLIGLLFMLPLAVSELSTNGLTYGNVSSLAALFGLMWLLPAVFFSVLGSLLRNRAEGVRPYSTSFVVGTLLSLACIVTVWMSILIDQIPCFVGAANCD
jgi:hypothetical protein